MNRRTMIEIREFGDRYFEPGFKNTLNEIRLSKANHIKHNFRLCSVCCLLINMEIPFYTEVRLKCGLRVDIVCPSHTVKCIEILHSETPEKFRKLKLSKIPKELRNEFVLISTDKPINLKSFM